MRAGRSPALVLLASLTVLPLAVMVIEAALHLDRQPLFAGDFGFIELFSRSALRGEVLVGPYSRFGWNHPGPLSFYWFAPFYALAGQRPEGLGLASALLNLICLGGVVAVARRAGGPLVGWAAGAVVLMFLRISGLSWLDRPWNPVTIVMPVALVGVLGAAAVAGRRWALAGMALAVSFAVQTHVGTAPVVAAICVGLLGLTAWRWRRIGIAPLRPLMAALAVVIGAWALPVYEQASDRPGNLGELLHFLRTASPGHHPLGQVLGRTAEQLTLSRIGLIPEVLASSPTPPSISGARLALLLALEVTVAVALWRNLSRDRWFAAGLCVAGLCGSVGVVVGCVRVVGDLYGHLTLPATSVGLVLWLAVAATAAGEIQALRDDPSTRERLRAAGALVVGALAVMSVYLAVQVTHTTLFAGTYQDPTRARAVESAIQASRHARSVLIDPVQSGAVLTSALFANQLERHGVVVHAPRGRNVFFGRQRQADGCEDVRLLLTTADPVALPPRARKLAVVDTVSLYSVRLRPRC